VGTRVFDHICRVAGGEVQARAEVHKHREFQVWTQSAISL
jgi:altronate dehydratase